MLLIIHHPDLLSDGIAKLAWRGTPFSDGGNKIFISHKENLILFLLELSCVIYSWLARPATAGAIWIGTYTFPEKYCKARELKMNRAF